MPVHERLYLVTADLFPASIDVITQPSLKGVVRLAVDDVRGHHIARAVKAIASQVSIPWNLRVEIRLQAGRSFETELAGLPIPYWLFGIKLQQTYFVERTSGGAMSVVASLHGGAGTASNCQAFRNSI